VNLGLVKIHAYEVHSVRSPLSAEKNQKPHIEASTPLPTADNSHARNMRMHPEPISSPRKWVLEAFPDVHTGLGEFGRPVSFDSDPTVTHSNPVHDAMTPVALHAKIKKQLNKMESEGKICRQYEPTAWCSNMTVSETKDKFRICLDPSNTINKAIRVPKLPIPCFEDILPQLHGAKCFSFADAMSFNILLDHESSLATTFHLGGIGGCDCHTESQADLRSIKQDNKKPLQD